MRKLIAITQVTLDGVMQGPGGPEEDPSNGFTHGGWAMPFVDEAAGPGARVSVELSAASAQSLIQAIQAALDSGAAEHGHPLVAASH